ncbi:unnamed protein product [Haemonchus placei]|uniref:PET domain-containing protein n=1 Tax=Haemonchus placei TaxID=6290 RepID=A0A0N4X5Z6_HAEPC|nr:unnamed protein product [Haemonchus placei]
MKSKKTGSLQLPTSVTMPTYPGDRIGESLTDFSEAEWKEGRQAYPADFLNLLRDDGHVHVFAPREKAAEYLMSFGERRRRRHRPKRDVRMYGATAEGSRPILSFGELVQAITDLLNEDKEQNEGVKVLLRQQEGDHRCEISGSRTQCTKCRHRLWKKTLRRTFSNTSQVAMLICQYSQAQMSLWDRDHLGKTERYDYLPQPK